MKGIEEVPSSGPCSSNNTSDRAVTTNRFIRKSFWFTKSKNNTLRIIFTRVYFEHQVMKCNTNWTEVISTVRGNRIFSKASIVSLRWMDELPLRYKNREQIFHQKAWETCIPAQASKSVHAFVWQRTCLLRSKHLIFSVMCHFQIQSLTSLTCALDWNGSPSHSEKVPTAIEFGR